MFSVFMRHISSFCVFPGGSSQFGFLELSQSQDLEAGGDLGHRSESKNQKNLLF